MSGLFIFIFQVNDFGNRTEEEVAGLTNEVRRACLMELWGRKAWMQDFHRERVLQAKSTPHIIMAVVETL